MLDINKTILKQKVEKTDEPLNPKLLPNNPAKQALVKGNVIINVYIFLNKVF
jgi:hypothetical protein